MGIGFKGYHPVANLIFFASIVVFGMLFKHPVTLAVCFIAAVLYWFRLCKKTAVKSFLVFILPMLIIVVIINGLFAHYGITQLLTLPDGNTLTLESLVYGFVLGLVTITVIMWFFCYNEIVTADKFMFVFGKILPSAVLVISMALRFIPLYKSRLKIIAEAQRGIGRDYRTGPIKQRIKNGGKIISILITWSLENAVETADSMRARGYGLKGRKNYGKFRWSTKDIVVAAIIFMIDVILAVGYASKSLYCIYNPYIIINPSADFGKTYFVNELNITLNPTSIPGIITLAAFTLLCFLPLIIDFSEEIKWNRIKSEM